MKFMKLMFTFLLALVITVDVFADQSDKLQPGASMQLQAAANDQVMTLLAQAGGSVTASPKSDESVTSIPPIQWSMSAEQISRKVDLMIAATNRSNPIGGAKQKAFVRALSNVRDAVVKNDMAMYQKAIVALASRSNSLSATQRSKLDGVLAQAAGAGLESSCSTSCWFGSCSAKCGGGVGGGAYCGCIAGFPQCGCGGGGSSKAM